MNSQETTWLSSTILERMNQFPRLNSLNRLHSEGSNMSITERLTSTTADINQPRPANSPAFGGWSTFYQMSWLTLNVIFQLFCMNAEKNCTAYHFHRGSVQLQVSKIATTEKKVKLTLSGQKCIHVGTQHIVQSVHGDEYYNYTLNVRL